MAYLYAKNIDKCPRNDTRRGAYENPEWAYNYMKNIDKCFHQKTWEVTKNTEYEKVYNYFLNQIEKRKII